MMAQSAGSVVEYEQIYLGGRFFSNAGKIRFAEGGVGWKDGKTGAVTTIRGADMRKLQWLRVSNGFEVRVVGKTGQVYKFDGFAREAYDDLKTMFKRNYELELEAKEVSVRGWNWGRTDFQGNSLFFEVANKPMLEVPLGEVANSVMASKNEVSVEFKLPTAEELAQNRDAKRGDQLVEMRFFIPNTVATTPSASASGSDNGDNDEAMDLDGKAAADENTSPNETEDASPAAQFHDMIKSKADVGTVAGECIVPFHELPFVTPRGRYEVEMFEDCLRMHGKTYDYKILYNSIKHLFLLPKADDLHMLFVVGLEPPIRQGQTRYPFLVMQFLRDEDIEVSLTISPEDLRTKFGGRLQSSYEASTAEVVSSVFHVVTDVPLQVPTDFKSHFGAVSVKCSMKANEGYLFPLADCLLFIPKPTLHMAYNDMSLVQFSRVGGSAGLSRTFDMTITMKRGADQAFNNIAKEEYGALEEFLKKANVRVKHDFGAEDMNFGTSSDAGEESDSGGRGSGRAAAKAAAAINVLGDDLDDDDESDDEDFVEEAESDVEEEYNEDYESSGDENDDDAAPKKASKDAD